MAFSRYTRSSRLNFNSQLGSSRSIETIRAAIKSGQLPAKQVLLRGAERLDTLAGELYGDGRYWWVLAAASDIGWGLQVPAGTVISVPDISAVSKLVG